MESKFESITNKLAPLSQQPDSVSENQENQTEKKCKSRFHGRRSIFCPFLPRRVVLPIVTTSHLEIQANVTTEVQNCEDGSKPTCQPQCGGPVQALASFSTVRLAIGSMAY